MKRAILIVAMVALLFPVWMMVVGSLQDIHGVFVMPPRLLPLKATLQNYEWIFRYGQIGRWTVNTLFVTAGYVTLSVFLSITAGYAFAFYRWKGKKALWLVLLAGLFIPKISILIPLFVVVRKLGLSGTLAGVVIPVAFAPVGLYLAKTYFETIPISLLESARMDGASETQILFRIVTPLARPIVTALALFAAIQALQDYLWQMLQLNSEALQTLVVGITRATMKRGGAETQVNPLGRAMAGGTMLVAPLLVVFGIANRYFTSALGGAVKE